MFLLMVPYAGDSVWIRERVLREGTQVPGRQPVRVGSQLPGNVRSAARWCVSSFQAPTLSPIPRTQIQPPREPRTQFRPPTPTGRVGPRSGAGKKIKK